MSESTAPIKQRTRRIAHRTFGKRQGPITRLMSPSDFGRKLKPFVFLDLFDAEDSSLSGFGWHPHSGIATLTYLWEGNVRYEDTTGAAGFLPAGGVEWFKAAGGAWHGGGAGNAGRSRGFQLWLALPPDQELGPAESIYQKPQDIRAKRTRLRPARHPWRGVEPARGAVLDQLSGPAAQGRRNLALRAAGRSRRLLGRACLGKARCSRACRGGRAGGLRDIDQAIDFHAEADTEFVLGSAVSHPYELALGYYSVHTSPASLHAGEQRIAEIKERLQKEGRL